MQHLLYVVDPFRLLVKMLVSLSATLLRVVYDLLDQEYVIIQYYQHLFVMLMHHDDVDDTNVTHPYVHREFHKRNHKNSILVRYVSLDRQMVLHHLYVIHVYVNW